MGTSTACLLPHPCHVHRREAAKTVPAGAAREKGGSMRYRYFRRGMRRTTLQMEVNTICLHPQEGETSASPELLLVHQVESRELITLDPMQQHLFPVCHQLCFCQSILWSYAETEPRHLRAKDATLLLILLKKNILSWLFKETCGQPSVLLILFGNIVKYSCDKNAGILMCQKMEVRERNSAHCFDDVSIETTGKLLSLWHQSLHQIYVLMKTVQPHEIMSQLFIQITVRAHSKYQNS